MCREGKLNMPHFDLEEQEQLSKLKNFWRDWGKYVVGIIVVSLIVYLSNRIWVWKNEHQAAEAAKVYAQFTSSVEGGNAAEVYVLAKQLEAEYPKVEYSALASIWAAKIAQSHNQKEEASRFLTWTIANAKDPGLVSLARLRLADLYIDQQKFDKALSLLMQKHDPAFDVLYYAKRGDLYVVKGDLTKARDAYKEALQKAGQDSGIAQTIQLKLDVLGGN
jgi:predicted negative regulator of RcsB-dependent stress response